MYEDLNDLVRLKFVKEMEVIAAETRQNVQDAANRFAATAGAGIRSGQHDALLCRLRIDGVEKMARTLFKIWVDLITQRNGHIARPDIAFIGKKIEEFVGPQKANLRKTFGQQGGAVVPSMMEQAGMRMHAVCAFARRDLEIMVREYEVLAKSTTPKKEYVSKAPSRYSIGRRVLFGTANQPATVRAVADAPSQMGEFVHELLVDKTQQVLSVLGCDMRPFPDVDEDLRGVRPMIHIENSNVANLNLGSQIGTINATIQSISKGDDSQREFAHALEEFTQAVVAATLPDSTKQEVVEALSTIAEQANKKPEERSRVPIKALMVWIPTALATTHHLVALWDKFGPSIKAFFGI